MTTIGIATICIGAAMAALLVLGAVCDIICREVPDSISVSFCALGIINGIIQGRGVGAALAYIALIALINGYQPFLFRKIGERALKRSYEDELSLAEENAQIDAASDVFYERHGKVIYALSIGFYLASVFVITLYLAKESIINTVAIITVGISIPILTFVITKINDKKEHEEISGMGGADTIVLLGILAYFGLINGVYAITAQMTCTILLYMLKLGIQKLLKRDGNAGFPLLPYLVLSTPAAFVTLKYLASDTAILFAESIAIFKYI